MLGKVGVRPANQAEPYASFHPLFEGRQHALRPDRRFGPGPAGPDLSRLRSPIGHCRGGTFPWPLHHASTFLHPFARRALPRVLATMGALTPARVSTPGQVSLLHVHGHPDHSASNHPGARRLSFRTLPLSSTAHRPPRRSAKASPLTSRLAGPSEPNRVRHPTDWSVASCCFPPRLTATQLHSATGWKAFCLGGTFTPLTLHARRRTSSAFRRSSLATLAPGLA